MSNRLLQKRLHYYEWRLSGSGNDPFPYIVIPKTVRDEQYEKLRELDFKPNEEMTLSNIGNKTSNYYFQKYRSKTKTGKWSQYERWKNDPDKIRNIALKLYRKKGLKKISDIEPYQIRDSLRMSGNSVNQFKPYVAVYVYQKFKPNRILDISAGWGDRLIGAMSQDIDYIGIDSNKKLEVPYNNMIRDFKDKTNSKVQMIFKKSEDVDYSKLPKYDLIFTSPPYFSLEKYEGMTEYDDNKEFAETYFIPTIKEIWKYLSKGGVLALNMPEEMYKLLVPILGRSNVIKMPIQNRFNFKVSEKKYESIYWWKKD